MVENLNGLDGCFYTAGSKDRLTGYIYPLMERGFSMIWRALSWYGKSWNLYSEQVSDSKNLLQHFETPICSIHCASSTQKCFHWIPARQCSSSFCKVYIRDWFHYFFTCKMERLFRTSDSNCIENLSGVIVRDVYQNGRLFRNNVEMTTAVCLTCNNLSQNVC